MATKRCGSIKFNAKFEKRSGFLLPKDICKRLSSNEKERKMTGATGQATERPKIAAMERGRLLQFFLMHFMYSCDHIGPGPARYTLPSLTGIRAHDATKKINPCYSFGTKLGTSCESF